MSCGCPAIYTNMKYKHVLELWADLWPADTSKNISFFSSKGSCFQSHVSLTYVSILSYISWTSFLWLWNPRDWMSGQQWVNSMCVCVCVCVCMHTHMHTHTHTHTVSKSCQSICDPWTVAHQAPLSMGFPRQEYWSGLPFPPPGDLPDPGIEPASPSYCTWQVDSLPRSYPESPLILSGMGRIEEGRRGKGSNWCLSAMRTVSSLMGVPSLISHAACSSPRVKETYHPQDAHVTCFPSRFQE